MFCFNCGQAYGNNDLFCGNCGTQKPEPKKASFIRNINKKWLIIGSSLAVVVVFLVIVLAIKGSGALDKKIEPVAIEETANTLGSASELESSLADNQISSEKLIEQEQEQANAEVASTSATEEQAPARPQKKTMYLNVNQVDSSRYEQGQVDVYFSLFGDLSHSHPIELEQLSAKMFEVNEGKVLHVAKVEDEDQVSVNLVIDKSGSMLDYTVYNRSKSKIELVKEAAITFLENIPEESKGNFEVISFSDYAPEYPDLAFTSNRQDVIDYLSYLYSDGGSTALYDTLTKALYETDTQAGPKYIIAFTDGMDSNYGSSADSVVQLSLQLGIPIYTIGFGDAFSELQWIAEQTGGKAFIIDHNHDLQTELENIYQQVFNRYTKQYKLVYRPTQQVNPGDRFDVVIAAETDEYIGESYGQSFTRKIESTNIDVMNALFEYQISYARAVNQLDFHIVSGHVYDDTTNDKDFYNNLKNRIEIDYVKLYENGTPKYIEAIEKYKTENVEKISNDVYKIQFFKLFPVFMDNQLVYEADLNTYTLKKNAGSGVWQVSDFARNECSIYDEENGVPSSCKSINGVDKLYSRNPWQ